MYFGVVCPEPRQPKAAFSVPCDGGSGAIFINWDYFHFPDSKTRDLRAVQNASPCRCETLVLCLACLQFSSVLFFCTSETRLGNPEHRSWGEGNPFPARLSHPGDVSLRSWCSLLPSLPCPACVGTCPLSSGRPALLRPPRPPTRLGFRLRIYLKPLFLAALSRSPMNRNLRSPVRPVFSRPRCHK